MKFRLIPSEEKFFDFFQQLVSYGAEAHQKFRMMFEFPERAAELHGELKSIEKNADSCASGIIDKLDATFVTPLDREDIYTLTHKLDNVVDGIESAGRRVKIFAKHLGGNLNFFAQAGLLQHTCDLTEILGDSIKALVAAVGVFSSREAERINSHHIAIHQCENRGDDIWEGENGVLDMQTGFLVSALDAPMTKGDYLRFRWETGVCHKIEDTIDAVKETADCISSIVKKYA